MTETGPTTPAPLGQAPEDVPDCTICWGVKPPCLRGEDRAFTSQLHGLWFNMADFSSTYLPEVTEIL